MSDILASPADDTSIDHYVSMFRDPELSRHISDSPAIIKERLQRYSSEFLDGLMDTISESTDDSRSLLLHLVDESATERDIVAALRTTIRGFSYADTALVLVSLLAYERLGFVTDHVALSQNAEQVTALHRIMHAVRFAIPVDTIQPLVVINYPLVHSHDLFGSRPVFHIKDRELFNLTLKHAAQSKAIARLIREHGELNIPALRFFLEGGQPVTSAQTESYRFNREEIIAYYTEMLLKREVQEQMHVNWRYSRGHLQKWEVDFLNFLKPFIDQNNDDSRSLLLSLIDASATEEGLRQALIIHKKLDGPSFAGTATTIEALNHYHTSRLIPSVEEVRDNTKQLIALHAVTAALETVSPYDSRVGRDVLGFFGTFIGKNPILCIKDKLLIDIILEHPEHGPAIAQSILDAGDIRYPAIHSILSGEAAPLSNGAL